MGYWGGGMWEIEGCRHTATRVAGEKFKIVTECIVRGLARPSHAEMEVTMHDPGGFRGAWDGQEGKKTYGVTESADVFRIARRGDDSHECRKTRVHPAFHGRERKCKMSDLAKGRGQEDKAWYIEGESQIHFFPGPKRLIWTIGKKIMLDVEAWGGIKGVRHHHFAGDPVDGGMRRRPTTPGNYVISGWAPYRTNKWEFSRIPWGTELRLDVTGRHLLFKTGMLNSGAGWSRSCRTPPSISCGAILKDVGR